MSRSCRSCQAEQYGAGSAVNDTVQELGGSLGIAVIGSIVASSFRHSLDAGGLPAALIAPARSSIAAADATAAHAGPLAARVFDLAHQSFTSAMTTGFTVAGLLAVGGAVIVAIALPRRRTENDSTGGLATAAAQARAGSLPGSQPNAATPTAGSGNDGAPVLIKVSAARG